MGDNLPAVDLGTGRTAQALAAGYNHTCALLDDGTVKCWGWNYTGQLGLGDTSDRGDAPLEMGDDLPAVDLGTGRTAQALAAGYLHTCALLDDGTVKCWGRNNSGQLGLGDTGDRGQVIGEMGDDLPAVDLGTGRTAQALAAGEFHTCALLDDGTVKCWGRNGYGQLGLGDTSDRGDEPVEMGDALPAIYLGSAP
jgi:E3 ubiquitin-protein ligase HERC3